MKLIIILKLIRLIDIIILAESDTGSEDYLGFSTTSTAGINSPQVGFFLYITGSIYMLTPKVVVFLLLFILYYFGCLNLQ